MPIQDQTTAKSRDLATPGLDHTALPISGEADHEVLTWLHAALQEGQAIIQQDPSYANMDKLIDYVMGKQYTGRRPSYLSDIVVNRLKKAITQHVSALTDLRPLFAYKTENVAYKLQADILNRLTVIWWINTFADLDVADGLRYAETLGTTYFVVDWDPHLGAHGDTRLRPKDPRDVLPIRPSRDRSLQTWQGVIIREAYPLNALRNQYPEKAHLLTAQRHAVTKFGAVKTAYRKLKSLITPTTTMDGLDSRYRTSTSKTSLADVPVFRVYLHDLTINETSEPITMGNPLSNWSYVVQPAQRLYPRGRLIVATEYVVLYDGPNPYWHGLFPVVPLKLDPWPWQFLGLPRAHDLLPAQEGLNKLVNDIFTHLGQATNPGTSMDKNAVPESVYKAFDARKAGWKLRVNPVFGDSIKVHEPAPLPAWTLQFLQLFFQEFDNLAGVANLQALLQLRQSPSADTIQKYWEALTPEIRVEGRLLEAALREIAEMVKCNFFQFYSSARRVMLLGDAGGVLEDLDYDPDTLVPAMDSTDDGYIPELDKKHSRDKRAQFFMKLFVFYVAPNSLLAMYAMERKMLYVQLARMGYLDFWTLMEMLEIPNVGEPPMVPIPTGEMQPGIDPMSGLPAQTPVTELKKPTTITERLIAQAALGIGLTTSPSGRKATGQAPPRMERKPDQFGGQRTTITESR